MSSARDGLLSMKLLLRQVPVSRQTVHFYLRRGLLPPPVRTNRTFALYSAATAGLLHLIRECQAQRRLSLDEIQALFRAHEHDPARIRAALDRDNGHAAVVPGAPPAAPAIEYSPGWRDALRRAGLLSPEAGQLTLNSGPVAGAAWRLATLGIRPEDLKPLAARIDQAAQAELDEFARLLSQRRFGYEELIRAAEALREFVHARREYALQIRFLQQTCRSAEILIGPNQNHVFPSETFLARSGLNQEIDRLLRRLDRAPDDLRALRNVARAYYLRSDWLSLDSVARKILHLDPANVRAVADRSRALVHLGRIEESIHLLEVHLQRGPSPLLKFRLGQVLVLRARGGSIGGFLSAVVRKQQLAAEALRETRDPAIRRWIQLDLALDNLGVSDPLRLRPPSAEEVEALYREYAAIPDKGLSTLSRIGLVMGRTLAAYALFLVYERAGSPKAEPLRRKIIQVDPHSVLFARPRSK